MQNQDFRNMVAKVNNLEWEVSQLKRELKKANEKLDLAIQYLSAFDPVMARIQQAQSGPVASPFRR